MTKKEKARLAEEKIERVFKIIASSTNREEMRNVLLVVISLGIATLRGIEAESFIIELLYDAINDPDNIIDVPDDYSPKWVVSLMESLSVGEGPEKIRQVK